MAKRKTPLRVLVFGGRDYENQTVVYNTLTYLLFERFGRDKEDIIIVNGVARGADSLGRSWAIENGVKHDDFPAQWKKYGKKAGPTRNQEMLDSGIDLGVRFPGGNGTADMTRRLQKAGVPIVDGETHRLVK